MDSAGLFYLLMVLWCLRFPVHVDGETLEEYLEKRMKDLAQALDENRISINEAIIRQRSALNLVRKNGEKYKKNLEQAFLGRQLTTKKAISIRSPAFEAVRESIKKRMNKLKAKSDEAARLKEAETNAAVNGSDASQNSSLNGGCGPDSNLNCTDGCCGEAGEMYCCTRSYLDNKQKAYVFIALVILIFAWLSYDGKPPPPPPPPPRRRLLFMLRPPPPPPPVNMRRRTTVGSSYITGNNTVAG
ncbi:uncharacterized protein LOC131927797 [Physella acuta]|uniref:uncharacterized protein LOC131927797 n=1 Tax=Physella acuta TaxID=109671 RepID=UPI0027DB3A5B|nr:uncharacterized protein LOC131927797 [Physella acuta]